MFCMLKNKTKKTTSYSFNDSKWKGWVYLAVKKLSALLEGITSKHHSDFCCLNCLHSFATESH